MGSMTRKFNLELLTKQAFNSNDLYRKIAQYSPSESTKLYDKAMQRRNIQPFNPKATIALLKEAPTIGGVLSEAEKRVLIDRYLEVSSATHAWNNPTSPKFIFSFQFKQLMIKLDPEEEADEDEQMKTPQKNQLPPPNTSQATNDVIMNHMVTNNVQINSRVNNLPIIEASQNFVSFLNLKQVLVVY